MQWRLPLNRDPGRCGVGLYSWSEMGSSPGAEDLALQRGGRGVSLLDSGSSRAVSEQREQREQRGRDGKDTALVRREPSWARAEERRNPGVPRRITGHRGGRERGEGGLPGFSLSPWKFGVAICERGRCRQRGGGADGEPQVPVPFAVWGCQVGSGG